MLPQVFVFVLVLCTRLPAYTCEPYYSLRFIRTEAVRGDEVTEADYSAFRVMHLRRGSALNGTYTYTRDLNNSDTCELNVRRSRNGDSNYQITPYHITYPVCEYFVKIYRQYAQLMFAGKTNFPTVPPEGIDPIPKGTYYVLEAREEDMHSILPPHLDSGVYKINTYFRNHKGQLIGGLSILARVEQERI